MFLFCLVLLSLVIQVPKGVDKDLRFCVTTIRECCLCSLSLYFSEITEDSTTILVIQFFCLVEKWEVILGLCLVPSQGNWLWEVTVFVSSLVSHRLLTWLGMHWLPHPTGPVFAAAAGSSQIRILRNYSSITLMPSALSEAKGKAGSNSIPGFLGPFKINHGGKAFSTGSDTHFYSWINLNIYRSKSELPAKSSHSSPYFLFCLNVVSKGSCTSMPDIHCLSILPNCPESENPFS